MDNTGEILNKANKLLKERYGEDFVMGDGDEFVFCLNNGVLILSIEDRHLEIKIIGNEAFTMDMDFGMFVAD